MKIKIRNATEMELSELHRQGFDILSDDQDTGFGSMQMFTASVALCTFSVLAAYGQRFDAGAEDIVIRLIWHYAERPYRIADIDMKIHWPSLPESRLDAATRAAHHCTLHNTLQQCVEIDTLVDN